MLVKILILVYVKLVFGIWYIDQSYNAVRNECQHACETTMDCPIELSCFHASQTKQGCCLPVLKPNQTDCILDEQCSRACVTSYCNRNSNPTRCVCHEDYHYLFGKCWATCPPFAIKLAPLLYGHNQVTATQCLLNKDYLTENELRELELKNRQKRNIDNLSNYC